MYHKWKNSDINVFSALIFIIFMATESTLSLFSFKANGFDFLPQHQLLVATTNKDFDYVKLVERLSWPTTDIHHEFEREGGHLCL